MPPGRKPSKYRYFMLVVQSDDKRIEAVIAGLKQRWHAESIRIAYIEHDRDRGVDPHYHIVIAFRGPVSRDDVARYLGVKRAMVRVLTGGEKGLAQYLRYMVHEDPDPDVPHGEHLYDREEVRANFDWELTIRNANLSKTRSPKLRDVQLMLLKVEVTVDDVMDKWPELYIRNQAQIDKMAKAGEARRARLAEQAKIAKREEQDRLEKAAAAARAEQEAREQRVRAEEKAREEQRRREELARANEKAKEEREARDRQREEEEKVRVEQEARDRAERERTDPLGLKMEDLGLSEAKVVDVLADMWEIPGDFVTRQKRVEEKVAAQHGTKCLRDLCAMYVWDVEYAALVEEVRNGRDDLDDDDVVEDIREITAEEIEDFLEDIKEESETLEKDIRRMGWQLSHAEDEAQLGSPGGLERAVILRRRMYVWPDTIGPVNEAGVRPRVPHIKDSLKNKQARARLEAASSSDGIWPEAGGALA